MVLQDCFSKIITGEWGEECNDNKGTPIIRTTNFLPSGKIDYSKLAFRSINQNKLKEKALKSGDIILEKSGGTDTTPVGRVVYCDERIDESVFLCNNFTQAMRVDRDIALPKFMFYCMHYLHQSGKTDLLQNKTTGIRNLRMRDYLNQSVALPSVIEQHRIATILDKAIDIIALRKKQCALLDLMLKSRFVEMFGDPVTNPLKWKSIKLGNALIEKPQNGLYKPASSYVNDDTGTPILRIDAFYDGKLKELSLLKRLQCSENEVEKYRLENGDIVINRVNSIEYLGKCAYIIGLVEDTVFESNMMRIKADRVILHPLFLTKILCTSFIYNQVLAHAKKAVNQASINQQDVQDFDLLLPPLELQNSFVDFVRQVDKSKFEIQQGLKKLELQYNALMQQYFG